MKIENRHLSSDLIAKIYASREEFILKIFDAFLLLFALSSNIHALFFQILAKWGGIIELVNLQK